MIISASGHTLVDGPTGEKHIAQSCCRSNRYKDELFPLHVILHVVPRPIRREGEEKNDALVRLALRYNSYTKTFVLNTMIVNFVKY